MVMIREEVPFASETLEELKESEEGKKKKVLLRLENFTLSISAVNLFVWAALFINSSVQLIVLIRPLLKI